MGYFYMDSARRADVRLGSAYVRKMTEDYYMVCHPSQIRVSYFTNIRFNLPSHASY